MSSGGDFGPVDPPVVGGPPFTVAGPSTLSLDGARSGSGSFTVSNVTGRPVRARVLVVPGAGADAAWFQVVGESERQLPVAGTATVDVTVKVAEKAPAGAFSFAVGAALEEAPDQVVSGPNVTFQVAEPKKRKFPWWIVIVAAAALLLLGGGGLAIWFFTRPTPSPTPSPSPSPTLSAPAAAWLNDGRLVAVVTPGSADCVPIVGDIVVAAETLVVELTDPVDESCEGEDALRASLVIPTEALNATRDHEIVLTGDYEGVISLPSHPDAVFPPPFGPFQPEPNAGWFSADDFVLLTYGSSSCPPLAGSATITAADEVTVNLVPSSEGQCTLDFSPRLTVVETDGSGLGDGSVTAALNGLGFDGVLVPITGQR